MATVLVVSPQARLSYLGLCSIHRSFTTTARRKHDRYKRSDFTGQGFTGSYEPGQPTGGPLGDLSAHGSPRITPRSLKEHLDQFVVGQDRAKKVMSVAVYNHYQRVQELQRREEEEDAILAQQERQAMGRHHVEDEYSEQSPTVSLYPPAPHRIPHEQRIGSAPLLDQSQLSIEKSNVLVLGPSGVGKTLMAKTLARVLEVPFSMSDCTPFTQAGYIGEDVEVCVQRLLAAANYDVSRAERGIICLDELDKIATARVSHGKDVSGEGVQQALLKIIEGTTVQVQAKQERGSNSPSSSRSAGAMPPPSPTNSPLSGGTATQSSPNKGETYNVNTDNILFICAGAFVGLHKVIMERLAKGSIGFGARVQRSYSPSSSSSNASSSSSSASDANDPTIPAGIPENDELFREHSPFSDEPASFNASHSSSSSSPTTTNLPPDPPRYNTLDLLTPTDLHKYGLIPELTGRLPITTALRPLTIPQLIRVLTEPRNALLAQYTSLLHLSGIELRFSTGALHAVAAAARDMGTGARGLRTVMERVLGEAMFEAPGSGVRFVFVGEGAVRRKERVWMSGREGRRAFLARVKAEEQEWVRRNGGGGGGDVDDDGGGGGGETQQQELGTFEQYRERAKIAGSG